MRTLAPQRREASARAPECGNGLPRMRRRGPGGSPGSRDPNAAWRPLVALQKCIAMCMDRYMDAWNTVSRAYNSRLQRERANM